MLKREERKKQPPETAHKEPWDSPNIEKSQKRGDML